MTMYPRVHNSPCSPAAQSSPVSTPTIRTSVSGSARPTVETLSSSGSSVRVWVMRGLELRYEHRRHTEHRRAPLLVHRLQDFLGVKALDRHHRPLVGNGVERPEHAAEAVEERHGDAHPVLRPELHAFPDVEGVLHYVRVGELYTFREPC